MICSKECATAPAWCEGETDKHERVRKDSKEKQFWDSGTIEVKTSNKGELRTVEQKGKREREGMSCGKRIWKDNRRYS